MIPPATEEFWSQVDKRGDCWVWPNRGPRSYGSWRGAGAHRVALNSEVPIPSPDMWALHRCDNPPCVRPAHLYWGTPSQNARDMIGRHPRYQRPKMVDFTFRPGRDLHRELIRVAQQEDRSVSSMVRVLLMEAKTAREKQ